MYSAKCITYGRVGFLEESLHSFLIQDDKDAEMIIVNDYPLQRLIFDHPRVRIYNTQPFDTIGEKENFACSLCSDTIIVWDDDDIALKNHITNIREYFKGGLMHWGRGIFLNGNEATITSIGNSGIVYEKRLWEKFKHSGNAGYDMDFVIKCKSEAYAVYPEKPSWVYRWGNGSYHMSGLGADTPDRDNVVIRHRRHIEELRLRGDIPTGDIILKPHWNKNYNL